MKPTIKILLFMALVVFVVGCTTYTNSQSKDQYIESQEPFVVESSSPSFPVSTKLTIAAFSGQPKLGSETELTFTALLDPSYDRIYSDTTASISLSEGINLVNGEIERDSDLIPGNPVSINSRIKFIKEGTWPIYYKWDYSGSAWSDGTICFSVSQDKISIKEGSDKRCPQTTLPPGIRETETEPPRGVVPSVPTCPADYEWDSKLQKCVVRPESSEPPKGDVTPPEPSQP